MDKDTPQPQTKPPQEVVLKTGFGFSKTNEQTGFGFYKSFTQQMDSLQNQVRTETGFCTIKLLGDVDMALVAKLCDF